MSSVNTIFVSWVYFDFNLSSRIFCFLSKSLSWILLSDVKMLCGDVDGDSSDDFEFSDGDNTKQDQKESNAYGVPTTG